MSVPESHYRRVPIDEATTPRRGEQQVYVDDWWSVTDDDCLLFYTRGRRGWYGAPQCNSDRRIAEKVGRGLYPWPTTLRQIPIVFTPVDR